MVAMAAVVSCTPTAGGSAQKLRVDLGSQPVAADPGVSSASPVTSGGDTTPEPEAWPTDLVGECSGEVCTTPREDAWAADRAAVVERIVEAGWGVDDDGVLRGPGGLEVDLNECPEDWDPVEGVSDDEIVLGVVVPRSGGLGVSRLDMAVVLYFDRLNDDGGLGGRHVRLEFRDDSYLPDRTLYFVQELLAEERPFLVTTVGSSTSAAVEPMLSASCVPQALTFTSAPAHLPLTGWRTGVGMTTSAEAALWVQAIRELHQVDESLSVAALVSDDDWGHGFASSFEQAVAATDLSVRCRPVFHDPAALAVDAEVETLLSERPDVLIVMAAGSACLLTINTVARAEHQPGLRILPTVCSSGPAYLEPAGSAADGWFSLGGGSLDLTDMPDGAGSYRRHVEEFWTAEGLDPDIPLVSDGWWWAWKHVELLRIASELPGGLTRPNYLLAAWSADLRPPGHQPGAHYRLDGLADAEPIETATLMQWQVADGGQGSWVPLGALSVE